MNSPTTVSTSRCPVGCSAFPAPAPTNGTTVRLRPVTRTNELLLKRITESHKQSRETYGSPRVHAELTLGLGMVVNEKRVARLMRQAGIRGLYVRRRRGCTVRNPVDDPAA